jgi:hypothetical protein
MKKSVGLVMIISMVCVVNAADIRYRLSGPWNQVSDGTSPGWIGAIPGAADTARVNWGGWTGITVTLDYAAPTITRFQLGVDESGTLAVGADGSITATGGSIVGNNNWTTGTLNINGGTVTNQGVLAIGAGNGGVKNAGWNGNAASAWGATSGVVEINGGTLNIGSHLWMARGSANTNAPAGVPTSYGSLTINTGGVVNVGGMIGLGTGDAVNQAAGKGVATITVNDGGLLVLSNIHASGTSVFPGSMFYLNGSGQIEFSGNFTGVMNDLYIPTYVTGNGILGNAVAAYDSGLNKTFVTAIPEPATLALLGLGVLGLLRKKQ